VFVLRPSDKLGPDRIVRPSFSTTSCLHSLQSISNLLFPLSLTKLGSMNNTNYDDYARDTSSSEGELTDYQQYILPVLALPSELRVEDVLRPSGIEAFIDESDYSNDSDSEHDFEDALSHFSQDQTHDILYDTDFDHAYPSEIPMSHSQLPRTYTNSFGLPTESKHQSLLLPSIERKPTQSSKLRHTPSRRSTKDPKLVTWEGPDDPDNPHNWPKHRRWASTLLIAMFAFIAPMASTMVAPALDTIADDFDIESDIEKFLVMSIFLLAFAIGPFVWGPMSEVFGRVRVMQCANLIFLLFNTVCGFAKTKQQMMAFRFLSGIGGSAPQAIGGGILSDCFRAGERGTATAIYSLMPFLSPAVAPIMGGYLTQYTTWRWVFWATSIFDAVVQIACFFLLKETFAPAILAKKVARLQRVTGNLQLHTKWQGPEHSMKRLIMKSLVRPLIMLGTQPALQAMALFRAYQYGLMYLVLATFNRVFEGAYDQSVGRASLNYLSLGVGFVIGLQISGVMQDKVSGSRFYQSVVLLALRGIPSGGPGSKYPANLAFRSTPGARPIRSIHRLLCFP
jgi:multidrug resistance protein